MTNHNNPQLTLPPPVGTTPSAHLQGKRKTTPAASLAGSPAPIPDLATPRRQPRMTSHTHAEPAKHHTNQPCNSTKPVAALLDPKMEPCSRNAPALTRPRVAQRFALASAPLLGQLRPRRIRPSERTRRRLRPAPSLSPQQSAGPPLPPRTPDPRRRRKNQSRKDPGARRARTQNQDVPASKDQGLRQQRSSPGLRP